MSALKNIRVLELAEGVCGEYCGKLLADFGAEIIKVEPPGGSVTRQMGPFASAGESPENSGLFAYLNTNKRSVTLDVTASAGAQTLQKLLANVDVVISDHADGGVNSLGLDLAGLQTSHPQLVVCSITGFGHPENGAFIPTEDLNIFHSSGWGFHTPSAAEEGRSPLKGAGRFLTSYESAIDAAMCVVASIYEREESKQGQFIDISKQAVLASRTDYVLSQMIAGDMNVSTDRHAFDLFGPASIFPCQDGFVYIWMSAPAHWQGLGELLGHPQWMQAFPENWLEKECTAERVAQVRGHITEWLKTQNKEAVSAHAQQLGLIMVPVNNANDLQSSPQYQFRGFFAEVDHPVLGKANYPTVPYKMSATPAVISSPGPLLGQHNEQVFTEMGAKS